MFFRVLNQLQFKICSKALWYGFHTDEWILVNSYQCVNETVTVTNHKEALGLKEVLSVYYYLQLSFTH